MKGVIGCLLISSAGRQLHTHSWTVPPTNPEAIRDPNNSKEAESTVATTLKGKAVKTELTNKQKKKVFELMPWSAR